jgi:hypothetical protein
MRAPLIASRVLISLLVGLVLAAGLQAPPAEASNASKVKALISKIIHSKNPKATYSKMSKANKALVKKELKGVRKTKFTQSTPTNANVTPSGSGSTDCTIWTQYTSVLGGYTRLLQYGVSNTTRVCTTSGWVTSVDIVGSYIDAEGLGWHPDTVKDSTLNVGWEGRGLTRGTFWWGVAGWRLFERAECAQVRINADLVHAQGRWSCSLA